MVTIVKVHSMPVWFGIVFMLNDWTRRHPSIPMQLSGRGRKYEKSKADMIGRTNLANLHFEPTPIDNREL